MAAFGPEELKQRSREQYVGNECGSDEYRETEPEKLLSLVAATICAHGWSGDVKRQVLQRTITWLQAVIDDWGEWGSGPDPSIGDCIYAGAAEAEPVFGLLHDLLWDEGLHPYYETVAELNEMLDF